MIPKFEKLGSTQGWLACKELRFLDLTTHKAYLVDISFGLKHAVQKNKNY
jgi:hypothetical protein